MHRRPTRRSVKESIASPLCLSDNNNTKIPIEKLHREALTMMILLARSAFPVKSCAKVQYAPVNKPKVMTREKNMTTKAMFVRREQMRKTMVSIIMLRRKKPAKRRLGQFRRTP